MRSGGRAAGNALHGPARGRTSRSGQSLPAVLSVSFGMCSVFSKFTLGSDARASRSAFYPMAHEDAMSHVSRRNFGRSRPRRRFLPQSIPQRVWAALLRTPGDESATPIYSSSLVLGTEYQTSPPNQTVEDNSLPLRLLVSSCHLAGGCASPWALA